ncbi:2-dehydro-3-deoxygalactonokinase, partial [Staphylococcus aureus]|nr:2-dehydro-3-deoxygalactonokinase [Staphylococcus aureus]
LWIGAEVVSMGESFSAQMAVTLVAGPALISRFQQAFSAIGRDVSTVDGDMAFQAGIRSIAHAVAN